MATVAEREFKVLNAKKESFFLILQNLYDLTKNLKNANNLKQFEILYRSVDQVRKDLIAVVDEINVKGFEINEDHQPDYKIISTVNELCCHIHAAASQINAGRSSETTGNAGTSGQTPANRGGQINPGRGLPSLPQIELPEFSGDIREWDTFYSLFKSLIHENKNLNDADRVTFLVGRLRGSALSVCSGITPTGDNYNSIWSTLLDKYQDKRYLANSYLKQLLDFRPLQNESNRNLNLFLENFHAAVNALKTLKLPDLSDYILMYLARSKLDFTTIKTFDSVSRKSDIPTYDELITFVKEQAKILHLSEPSTSNGKFRSSKSFMVNVNQTNHGEYNFRTSKCIFCKKGGHSLNRCERFKELSPSRRYQLVKESNWCYRCLSTEHRVKSCPAKFSCSKCSKNHHSLLHLGKPDSEENSNNNDIVEATSNGDKPQIMLCSNSPHEGTLPNNTVLLSTARVRVLNSSAINATARFLLDSGSQVNLITSRCCKRLGLSIRKYCSSVQGIGSGSQSVKGITDLVVTSRLNGEKNYAVKMLVVTKISEKFPKTRLDSLGFPDLEKIPLADDKFDQPGEIDGIIGAELFPLLLKNTMIVGPLGSPAAVWTEFGYVVMGSVPTVSLNNNQSFFTLQEDENIEQLLNKFWELEQVPRLTLQNQNDLACEALFAKTVERDSTGRFTVALPFKNCPSNLGDSRRAAQSRLLTLERRLSKFPKLRLDYNTAMKDFIDQGHLRLLDNPVDTELSYYIPHHPVIKEESTSTPVRIVLDASAQSESGVSLNDILHIGPKLQTEIFTLLLNFRLFRVALTGDIRQMYRQIKIKQEHWRYQRILWRFDPGEEIKIFELVVVAFGVKSSPFLALRTVKQMLKEDGFKYPLASSYIERDLYIDDIASSIPSEEEAIQLFIELVNLFQGGGFELTKLTSNSKALVEKIPVNKRLSKDVIFKTETKILGMRWDSETDVFRFKIDFFSKRCTKRTILSCVARSYDPLGLIAPCILYLKLLVKELWKMKVDWDEDPPEKNCKIWQRLISEWSDLEKLKFPRFLGASTFFPVDIIAFADACQEGYGAVIYMKTKSVNNKSTITLVTAKSKVAPCKIVTIPRLELCAALILSDLLKHVYEVYTERVVIAKVIAFSDSITVLRWLHASHIKDIFVANRVTRIKENIPTAEWRHIAGISNPADCLSRGLTPGQLINHPLWMTGPDWLNLPETNWPIEPMNDFSNSNGNVFLTKHDGNEVHPLENLMRNISSWSKLLRSMVYVLRFLRLLPKNENITANDLKKAELRLIRVVQWRHFANDIQIIKLGGDCSKNLRKLRPFMQDEVLRVGGRLSNSDLSFQQKHPIILPSKDNFTELLIEFHHIINLHTGPYLLEAILRQKYWILGARRAIRMKVHRCNRCARYKPNKLEPIMSDLPASRVQQCKAFLHTGVDYFGPINITLARRRGAKLVKSYVCIFICMSVKAVHFELVSSLSTQHFLQAFKRFLSRRGPCSVLYSDRGTNFVGAKSVLRELNRFINSSDHIEQFHTELANNGIEWKFNTPSAPHMGGLWERNIRSAKDHIYRVLGRQILTYEEFATLLTQVEAVINSRPLCCLSADSSAPESLTPSHFLTLSPLKGLPVEDVSDVQINRLDRFQMIDQMVQHFWKRWRLEYLSTLQTRQKWNETSKNISVGTVVVVKTDNSPPLHWPLAVIQEVHAGKDGIVRNVTLRTNKGTFTRPVVKVCPLPTQ